MFTKRQVEFLVPAFLICLVAVLFVIIAVIPSGVDSEVEGSRVDSLEIPPLASLGRDDTGFINSSMTKHTPLPEEVRGLYWTAFTATTWRADELLSYMLESGLNTVVIDVKMDNGELLEAVELEEILGKLYEAGIYRIARIVVM